MYLDRYVQYRRSGDREERRGKASAHLMSSVSRVSDRVLVYNEFAPEGLYRVNEEGGFKRIGSELLFRPVHYLHGKAGAGVFLDIQVVLKRAKEQKITSLIARAAIDHADTILEQNRDEEAHSLHTNFYISDLCDPAIIHRLMRLREHVRRKIVVEILEDPFGIRKAGELPVKFIGNLHRLRQLGIRFAIDDFNPSLEDENISMNTLMALIKNNIPPNIIKLDGKFTRKILAEHEQLGHSILLSNSLLIHFLRNAGCDIIAEWVRTPEECAILKKYGITAFQGRELDKVLQTK